MLTTDTTILRESIDQLERGRRAMMAAPEQWFSWWEANVPRCGTQGCCWGFMVARCRTLNIHMWPDWSHNLSLNTSWGEFVFKMLDETVPDAVEDSAPYKRMASALHHYQDRDTANHMMKLLITRLRHRLAVCEVEQGEWGRQLPAAKMPVGEAREAAVEERELVTA